MGYAMIQALRTVDIAKVRILLGTTALSRSRQPGDVEFVCLMGGMMALISLSIDNLLPAFASIRATFSVRDANQMQYLLTAYMAGFGIMQLVYGLLSDVIGRRPTLTIGLSIYCLGSILALKSGSYEALLLGRVVQGMGAAAARVLTDAIICDRYSGHRMARALSLTMMIFIISQILAPISGQLTLMVADWRAVLGTMLALGLIQIGWFRLRLPETLPKGARRPLSLTEILGAVRYCLRSRVFLGYAMAMALMQATLLAYLGSSPVLFGPPLYDLGNYFGLAFGVIAAAMGLASLVNAGLVGRFGVRRVAHVALIGFIAVSTALLAVSISTGGKPTVAIFLALLAVVMFAFSLSAPNFSALAMDPMRDVAGTAASLIGSNANVLGAALGSAVGLAFNGSTVPLSAGFIGLAAMAMLAVLWAEGGRLFVSDGSIPAVSSSAV
jgi:DHA1 family bicyclomycin/chloramphenicol resistance-like MFS transporter